MTISQNLSNISFRIERWLVIHPLPGAHFTQWRACAWRRPRGSGAEADGSLDGSGAASRFVEISMRFQSSGSKPPSPQRCIFGEELPTFSEACLCLCLESLCHLPLIRSWEEHGPTCRWWQMAQSSSSIPDCSMANVATILRNNP